MSDKIRCKVFYFETFSIIACIKICRVAFANMDAVIILLEMNLVLKMKFKSNWSVRRLTFSSQSSIISVAEECLEVVKIVLKQTFAV